MSKQRNFKRHGIREVGEEDQSYQVVKQNNLNNKYDIFLVVQHLNLPGSPEHKI